jgi:hypothetical protein
MINRNSNPFSLLLEGINKRYYAFSQSKKSTRLVLEEKFTLAFFNALDASPLNRNRISGTTNEKLETLKGDTNDNDENAEIDENEENE